MEIRAKPFETLRVASRFDFGTNVDFMPIYLRGEAYLKSGNGAEAALAFEKILKSCGANPTSPAYALACLGAGRAYTLQGDNIKARKQYNDLLTLWKDSDPNIPTLNAAKTEYANLP
jgi:tetratricopeptide (TPR) repeat protein